ncbi:MAG: hypothetical protein O9318_14535 [Hylemonella sp.]|uniref:DUF2441 domain-containing protein n=1 Tax=Hylemonella sp. TaxID=2066020 RepID=UPI0022C5CC15|nr:hypothetical protein [Hylemonella sp.]MCZ8253683.1 hypothetical protein [Hylemonella sp.]
MDKPTNLHISEVPQDFWVWVNPSIWLVKHQITLTGSFTSAGSVGRGESNLPFIPNPEFTGDVSPFSIGVSHHYTAEYNFEINRKHYFPEYPSRLNAIYLLRSESEAMEYKERHMSHVDGRVLKKVHTVGQYAYSIHDSSWVDFLRLPHSCDEQTIHDVTHAYWQGVNVADCQLRSMGTPWTESPIIEILYLGRIDFYERKLLP